MKTNFQKGILAVLTIFTTPAFAAINHHFYVGGMLGVSSLSDEENTSTPYAKHTLGASGLTGGGLIGYNYHFCDLWALGLEGFINAVSINVADNQNYAPQSSYTVNMRSNLGVRLLPTYSFTPETQGHVILGYASGNFKINDNGNYGFVNKSFSENGLQTGLGLQTALTPHLLLRGDVLYTAYASQTFNGITNTTPATTQSYRNQFSTLDAALALVYLV